MKFKGIEKIKGIKKKETTIGQSLSLIFLVMAAGMIPSIIFDAFDNVNSLCFIVPMAVMAVVGALLFFFTKFPQIINPVDGLLVISVIWVVTIIGGSIPFFMSGLNFIDSIFESASGITTTGATILIDIESCSRGLLIWRSMMQWIGGILVIFLFLFILPMIGFGSRSLFVNEMSGSGSKNLSVRMKDAGKQFVIIYLAFSVVLVAILLILGVSMYESLCISFSTISTGGFMPKNDSLGSFSIPVKLVVAIFMFLGGTNFYLHYKAIYHRKPTGYFHNTEFKVMVFVILSVTALGVWIIDGDFSKISNDEVVNVFFNVVSASTTTGFAASNYDMWYLPMVAMLFLVTVIGGSSGSTAGGLKISRVIIILKNSYNTLKSTLHPNSVYSVKLDGESMDKQVIANSVNIAVIFFLTLGVGMIIFMFFGIDFQHALTSALAGLTTFGPAVGAFGPYMSFATMVPGAKILMIFLMIVGRLEFLSAFIMLTPGYWKELALSKRKSVKDPFSKPRRYFRR